MLLESWLIEVSLLVLLSICLYVNIHTYTHTYIATYMYEFTILLLNLKVSDHSPISSPSLSPMSSTSPWIAGKLMYHSCLSI